jgi:hypothetical protein
MSKKHSPLARGLLVSLLAVGVLGFGAMGLCGGYFTAVMAPELLSPGGTGPAAALMLVVTLPCLLGGLFLVWICARKIGRLLSAGEPEDAS